MTPWTRPTGGSAALLLTLLATVASATPTSAQGTVITRATPAEAGMSAGVLAGGVALYEEAIARGDLVGAVLLVAKDGKVVLHEALGWRDKARGIPMEPNTMFRMASNTKPAVATGVAMLVEDGKLAWDGLVRDDIPEWDNYRAGFINLGHLLSHASGLRIPTLFLQPYMQPSAEHPDAPTLQLEAARFGSVGAEVTPGTSYRYNNPGYNTLGALVEIASGMPLEEYLDQELYTPLGMHDSYHHELNEKMDGKLDRMSVVYYQRDGEGDWTPGWIPGDPAPGPLRPRLRRHDLHGRRLRHLLPDVPERRGLRRPALHLRRDRGADDVAEDPDQPECGGAAGGLRVRVVGFGGRSLLARGFGRHQCLRGPRQPADRAGLHADAGGPQPGAAGSSSWWTCRSRGKGRAFTPPVSSNSAPAPTRNPETPTRSHTDRPAPRAPPPPTPPPPTRRSPGPAPRHHALLRPPTTPSPTPPTRPGPRPTRQNARAPHRTGQSASPRCAPAPMPSPAPCSSSRPPRRCRAAA